MVSLTLPEGGKAFVSVAALNDKGRCLNQRGLTKGLKGAAELPPPCTTKWEQELVAAKGSKTVSATLKQGEILKYLGQASTFEVTLQAKVRRVPNLTFLPDNVLRSATLFAAGEVIGLDDLRQLGDFFRVPDEPAMLLLAELTQSPEPPSSDPRPTSPTPASRSEPPPPVPDDGALPLATPTGLDAFGEDWLERAIAQEGGLHELKKRIEYEAIVRALKASGGNITRAAERLGMKRPRLSQIIHAIPALNHLKGEVGES